MFHVDVLVSGQALSVPILLLLLCGVIVGVLGGFFGVGGGWLVTLFLIIFCGLPEKYAVGTGFGYILGMSLISAWKHRKRGNMEYKLGAALGLPMILGVNIGKRLMVELDKSGKAGPVVQNLYMVMLFSLGMYMLIDSIKELRATTEETGGGDQKANAPLRRLKWGPLLSLKKSGIETPLIPILTIGLAVGVISGLMGVGGGFVLMPIMVYLVGMPTIMAVGTSLLCILYSAPMGVCAYSLSEGGSQVLFQLSGIMILGAFLGAPLGVWSAGRVHGKSLRLLYSSLTILGGISVGLKILQHVLDQPLLGECGKWLILGAPLVLSTFILVLSGKASPDQKIAEDLNA